MADASVWLLLVSFGAVLLQLAETQSANPILVPLTYETDDYEYFAQLGLGTPPTPFRLVIDTGSANIWVPSSSCSSLQCTQRAQFNPEASKTAKVTGKVVPIKYGTGQVLSVLVNDVVSLLPQQAQGSGGGSSSSSLPAAYRFRQVFGMATSMQVANASDSMEQPWDGLMGMGRQALAAGNAQVPVLSMLQQGVIDQPVFALYLVHNTSAAGAGGEMALGGWNADRLQGSITWIDVVNPQQDTQQGYWSVAVDQVQLAWPNGSSTTAAGTCSSSSSSSGQGNCIAMLDSGTAQLVGSLDQVAALNKALGGTPSVQQLPFDCQGAASQVLQATVDALEGGGGPAAANAVCSDLYSDGGQDGDDLQVMLCNAVQLQLFAATQEAGQPGLPSQASLALAQEQSAALCKLLPFASNVMLDCDGVQQLPNISFVLGGSPFTVSSRDFAYQSPTDFECYSSITALGSLYPGSWVLGDAFMHNYYTIFDFGTKKGSAGRVGIAALNAAEQAAQAALFDRAVAQKSSAAGSGIVVRGKLLLALLIACCLVVMV